MVEWFLACESVFNLGYLKWERPKHLPVHLLFPPTDYKIGFRTPACFCRKIGSRETTRARLVLSVLTALVPAMSIYDVAWQLHIYLSVHYPVKCFQKQKPCLLFGSGQSNNWCYLDAGSGFRLSSSPNISQRKLTMWTELCYHYLGVSKSPVLIWLNLFLPWLLINAQKILSLTLQILFYSLTPISLFVFQINSCFEIFPVTVFLLSKFFPLKVFINFPHHFRCGSYDTFCN